MPSDDSWKDSISLYEITANQVQQLVIINKTCFKEFPEINYTEAALGSSLIFSTRLAIFQDLFVGAVVLKKTSVITIQTIAVLKEYRNYNVGRLLLSFAISAAEKAGMDLVVAASLEESDAFFIKCGFEKDGDVLKFKKIQQK